MLNRDIINQTSRRLRDVSQKEWQISILVAAYNSALQTLMNVRPTSNTICRDITLKEGHEQEIDPDMHKLIHVLHNVCPDGKAKRAITLADMSTMDSTLPQWRQDEPRGYVDHYMMTETNDRKFHVWPPVRGDQRGELPIEPTPPEPVPDDYVAPIVGFDYANTTGRFIRRSNFSFSHDNGRSGWVTSYYAEDNIVTEDGQYYFENEISAVSTLLGLYEAGGRSSSTSTSVGTSGESIGYFLGQVFHNNGPDRQFSLAGGAVQQGRRLGVHYDVEGNERYVQFSADGTLLGVQRIRLADGVNYVPALGISSSSGGTSSIFTREEDMMFLPDDASAWPEEENLIETFETEQSMFIPLFNQFVADTEAFNAQPPPEAIRVEASMIPFVTEEELDDEMPLALQYVPALMEWMLYYCYSVDDEMTPNNQRGRSHFENFFNLCLLYTSPSPRDGLLSRMPSSA